MAKTATPPNAGKDPIPESLIEILCVRARWEKSVLAEIRQAHGEQDTKKVMSLLEKLFTEGPGSLKEKDHEGKA
jgi:hypothetical protein